LNYIHHLDKTKSLAGAEDKNKKKWFF
jgi:hypothetical protein